MFTWNESVFVTAWNIDHKSDFSSVVVWIPRYADQFPSLFVRANTVKMASPEVVIDSIDWLISSQNGDSNLSTYTTDDAAATDPSQNSESEFEATISVNETGIIDSGNYELVPGQRVNTVLLYLKREKCLYKQINKDKYGQRYKCFEDQCLVRVLLKTDGKCEKSKKKSAAHWTLRTRTYSSGIRGSAQDETSCSSVDVLCGGSAQSISVRSVFDNNLLQWVQPHCNFEYFHFELNELIPPCRDQAGVSGVEFGRVSRTLRRYKNEAFSASPKSGEELIAVFQKKSIMAAFGYSKHENPKQLYKDTIMDGDKYVCTFLVSEAIVELIKTNIDLNRRKYMMDATFKIVPVGIFKQLLIIIYVEYLDCVSIRTHTVYEYIRILFLQIGLEKFKTFCRVHFSFRMLCI